MGEVYKISTADTSIEWGLSGKERILQNVLNLLRTRKYEVPFMREMGIDPDYIDNVVSYVFSNLENEVVQMVEEYEYRATVLNVEVGGYDDNGNLIIIAEVEVE